MPDIDFQKIVLNLIPKQGDEPVVFYASQYETTRPFIADLMWGETEFAPGDDCWAEIDIRKNDDNLVVITDDVAIDNNEVSVLLPVQALTCIGKNLGQVKIYAGEDQLIAALNFILEVQPDPLAGGVTSETAIDNLTTQIDDIISGEGYVKDTDLDVLQSDWDEADPASPAYIKNKPSSGTQVQADWTEADNTSPAYIKNKPSLATVATTGSYNDLTDKPTIPAAQIQSDYAQTNSSAVDFIKNKPILPFESKGQYLLKTTPATKRSIEFTTLIGGTCGVNQLVDTGDTSVNTISGHKYLTRINHVESIIVGGSAVSINDSSEDNVIDLTAMFGTSIADYVYTLESGTSGAGITWLKNNGFFNEAYYPYNAGGLLSVKTSKKINRDSNNVIIGEYPLDDIELRGILKLDGNNNLYYDGDTYESNGSVTRKYGIVDLGSFTYNKNSTNIADRYRFTSQTQLSNAKAPATNNTPPNAFMGIYQPNGRDSAWANDIDKVFSFDNGYVNIYDSAYNGSTPEAVKTALDGVYLLYELATPTTETADPFTNPMIVDGNGTEEFVDGRTVEMPVGNDTFYIPMN